MSAYFWKLTFECPFKMVEGLDTAFEGMFDGVSWYAVLPDPKRADEIDLDEPWRLEAISASRPNMGMVQAIVELACLKEGLLLPNITVMQEEERDWLAENLQAFPPIELDDFYVYGSHIDASNCPSTKIAIKMDASVAFGTGKHETTKGCLTALSDLHRRGVAVRHALDMGTGSGILAFAIAKLWQCKILAVDIDAESPKIATKYAKENDVDAYITAVLGDGYKADAVRADRPFDLITANILANPLIDMAADLSACLMPGGVAILSGFLEKDFPRVQQAHQQQGLDPVRFWVDDEWVCLVMEKK